MGYGAGLDFSEENAELTRDRSEDSGFQAAGTAGAKVPGQAGTDPFRSVGSEDSGAWGGRRGLFQGLQSLAGRAEELELDAHRGGDPWEP